MAQLFSWESGAEDNLYPYLYLYLIQNGPNLNPNFCRCKCLDVDLEDITGVSFLQSDIAPVPVTQLFSWESTAEDNWTKRTNSTAGYICYFPKAATLYFSFKTLTGHWHG